MFEAFGRLLNIDVQDLEMLDIWKSSTKALDVGVRATMPFPDVPQLEDVVHLLLKQASLIVSTDVMDCHDFTKSSRLNSNKKFKLPRGKTSGNSGF